MSGTDDGGDAGGDTDGDSDVVLDCPAPGADLPSGGYDVVPDVLGGAPDPAPVLLSLNPGGGALDAQEVCGLFADAIDGDGLELYIYRPGVPGSGAFPSAALPVALLHHDEIDEDESADEAAEYRKLIAALVRDGFVVVSMGKAGPIPSNTYRARAHCALRYLATQWQPEVDDDILNCQVAFIGHGAAGLAAHYTRPNIGSDTSQFPNGGWNPILDSGQPKNPFLLQAIIELSPTDTGLQFGDEVFDPETITAVWGPLTTPLLVVASATDRRFSDTSAMSVLDAWEAMGPEDTYAIGGMPFQSTMLGFGSAPKSAIWVYDVDPSAWGGTAPFPQSQLMAAGGITPAENRLKGTTIAAAYASAFLRWQMLGDLGARAVFVEDAFPDETLDPQFWSYHPAYDASQVPDCGARTGRRECAAQPGCRFDPQLLQCVAIDCSDPVRPLQTAAECNAVSGCVFWEAGDQCVRKPLIKRATFLAQQHRSMLCSFQNPNSTNGLIGCGVQASSTFAFPEIDQVNSTEFGPEQILTAAVHHNDALGIRWGAAGQQPGGVVSVPFEQPQDLSAYTHLSMRVGIATDANGDNASCAPASTTPLSFAVTLAGNQPPTGGLESRTVQVTGIDAQEVQAVELGDGTQECVGRWFLETVRIPMRDFCFQSPGQPLSVDAVTELAFAFDPIPSAAAPEAFKVYMDSIEFTNDPADVAALCGVPGR